MVERIGMIVLDDLVEIVLILPQSECDRIAWFGNKRSLRNHEVQHAEAHHIQDSLVLKKSLIPLKPKILTCHLKMFRG